MSTLRTLILATATLAALAAAAQTAPSQQERAA
jgi:hypothetical protein